MSRPRIHLPATAEATALDLAGKGELTQYRLCDEIGVNQRTWRRIVQRDKKALEIYEAALDVQRDLLIQRLMTKALFGDNAAPGDKISCMFLLKSVHGLRDHGDQAPSNKPDRINFNVNVLPPSMTAEQYTRLFEKQVNGTVIEEKKVQRG